MSRLMTVVALLLVACGGAPFEAELFVGSGGAAGAAGAAATGGEAGTAAGGSAGAVGAAGAATDAGMDVEVDACTPVDDGKACTVDECDGTHTPLPGIDDQDACTVDSCDPLTGSISHEEVSHWKCASSGPCPEGFYQKQTMFSCENCGCPTTQNYFLCAPINC